VRGRHRELPRTSALRNERQTDGDGSRDDRARAGTELSRPSSSWGETRTWTTSSYINIQYTRHGVSDDDDDDVDGS